MAFRSRRTVAMSGARSMRACDEDWGKMHRQHSRWGSDMRGSVLARLLVTLLAVSGLGAIASASRAQAAPGDGRIVLPEDVIPAHYDVEVTPDVAHLKFSGRARIDVDVRQQTRRIE